MSDKFVISKEATDIAAEALRLDNDVNGNPRYYLSVMDFVSPDGSLYRPFGASKYRGKRYGSGWVFQSFALAYDIQHSLNHAKANGYSGHAIA